MSDVQQQISDSISQLAALVASKARRQTAIETLEKEAQALEQQARDKRAERAREREVLVQEIKAAGELEAVLRHSQVQKEAEANFAAASRAKTAAEEKDQQAGELLARLAEKEKQLDELLSKHEEQAPPAV